MEERGVGPILFYIRALTQPEEFWPLIEREIAARNFFLYCESQAAGSSQWVQREREYVKKIARNKAIRIGKINVDIEDLDFNHLARFLENTQVYIIGKNFVVASKVFESFGYRIIGGVEFSEKGLLHLGDGSQMSDDMISHFDNAMANGWLLVELSRVVVESEEFWRAMPRLSHQSRVIFVLPKSVLLRNLPEVPPELIVIQSGSLETAFMEAARKALLGGPT